jgi:hypothetical protein
MSSDVAAFYKHLRASTAKLLGYADADNLSAAQQIRLERAVSLRMICDDTAARQMRGQPYDVRAFTDASESLEKMCGSDPNAPTAGHDFSGARAELERHFERLAEAYERRLARDPAKARADLELKIQAALEKHGKPTDYGQVHLPLDSDPAGGPAQHDGAVTLPAPIAPAAAAGGCEHPVLIEPPPQSAPPPERVETDVEQMNRVNSIRPPDRYLKQPDAEWRAWVDENGIRSSPWSRRGY